MSTSWSRPSARDDRRSAFLTATEPVRALASIGASAASVPLLRLAPRGDAHPALVLPGLGAPDVSTGTLRRWIRNPGHPVVTEALPPLLARLTDEHGATVSTVGQSLGGIYARQLALRAPRQVRR